MAVRRGKRKWAERATAEAAAEQEEQREHQERDYEQERRKRIFDFIDSFRYTGSPSPSPSPSRLSRRGSNSNASKTSSSSSSFFIGNTKSTNTGPSPPSPPTPPVNVNVNVNVDVIAKKPTRKRRLKGEMQVTVTAPETPIAAVPLERRRKTTSTCTSNSKPNCKCRRSSLTAAEKAMDAYRRVPPGFHFTPPRSPHRLLQEDHAFDPWRVLIICMLLNNTTGAQVKKVVEDLFALCPDAHTTLQVDAHLIEHVIRTLGLQNKRARMIKILSQQYLDPGWTYVTSLHGVGKYAADAYAIFCTGKGADVRPDDHKLVDYWNSIYGNGSGVISQYAGEPSTKSAAPNAGNKSCNKSKKGFRESGSEKETAGTTDKSDKFNNGVTNVRDGTVSHFYLHGLIRDMIHKHQCATWLSTAENVVAHIGESKANDLDTKVKMLRIDEIKLRAMESSLMAELLGIVANEMADR